MTLLAFAYSKSQVLIAADTGLVTPVDQPADHPALPAASVTEVHKLRRVPSRNVVWALTGDPAEVRKIRTWLADDRSDSWDSLATGLGDYLAELNDEARKRQRKAGTKKAEIVQSSVLVAGCVDHLDAVILPAGNSPYFATITPLEANAVGVYGPLFNIAWQVAVDQRTNFSIHNQGHFHTLVSSLCKTGLIPGLKTPIDLCRLTKDSCEPIMGSVLLDDVPGGAR